MNISILSKLTCLEKFETSITIVENHIVDKTGDEMEALTAAKQNIENYCS